MSTPGGGKTALVALIPAVEHVLSDVAAVADGMPRRNLPAHVSILYPFLPSRLLTAHDRRWLRATVGSYPRPRLVIDSLRADGDFLYLPVTGLAPLVADIRARWPAVLPYGGRFGQSPEPHITIGSDASEQARRAVIDVVRRHLPFAAVVEQILLVELAEAWQLVEGFPFAEQQ